MPEPTHLTLGDCTEYRQTLLARPPRFVHGTVTLCVSLLGTAIGWAAWADANLVVRVNGRIRPVTSPQQVMIATGSELHSPAAGRVIAAPVRPGEEVHKGQLLLQLDTEALDNEIAKRQRTIRTGEEELAELEQLLRLAGEQYHAARAKAEAELNQARAEMQQAKDKQANEIRLARIERSAAEDEVHRVRQLARNQAASGQEAVRAELKLREAIERLAKAELSVPEGRIDVLTKAIIQLQVDDAVKRKEMVLRQRTKGLEVESARADLANLELQREQASLRAPCDGVITTGDVKVGDLLDHGKPVFEIAAQGEFRFEGTVPSDEVGHLRLGQPVRIKLDAYDFQRYGTLAGTVTFIAPDSRTGDGQKSVQHLVRFDVAGAVLGQGEWRGRVQLGMAGQAEVITGHESLLSLLIRRVRQSISLN